MEVHEPDHQRSVEVAVQNEVDKDVIRRSTRQKAPLKPCCCDIASNVTNLISEPRCVD
jgi:hypothetical protein